jgi:hypothetical protein
LKAELNHLILPKLQLGVQLALKSRPTISMVFGLILTTKELLTMSTHAYSRLWIHLIWETLNREPMLDKRAAAKASAFLSEYSVEKGIYMKINFFNADHPTR